MNVFYNHISKFHTQHLHSAPVSTFLTFAENCDILYIPKYSETKMNKNIDGVGEVRTPSTVKEKAQNFWYHYKWHSVVALFLVVTLLICSLQLCGRNKYDTYILYAGSKNIGRTAKDGDVAEIANIISAFKRVTDDFDGNGEVSVNFTNLYYLTQNELDNTKDVNDALLAADQKSLSSIMSHSEYYLMFISVGVYEEYHKVGDQELFIDLTSYAEYNQDAEYYAPNAIYLSSIDAKRLFGLPEDTLICIRQPGVMADKSREHQTYLENAKKVLINILKVEIPDT